MSTKNRTRRTTTRNIRFPNQMIEQINIALDQKGSGNFSAWVIEACRRRLTSEKRAYTSIRVMMDEHPGFLTFPPPHRTGEREGPICEP
ncbi:YlcI/YnfO family protein [Escherichia coli]|nr:YlcI/YnfO family protein [Escherichia coli]